MSKLTALRACILVIAASVLALGTINGVGAETVMLPNGQTYEVETDDRGEPLGAENREVEVTFLGLTSHASPPSESPVLEWVLTARLKRNRGYTVTVTTPIDETVSESFEMEGRGESVQRFFASDEYPAIWGWLEQPGTSWIPWVFRFENTASDDSFELTQWTKFPTSGKYVFLRNSYAAANLPFPDDHPSNESVIPAFDDRNWEVGNRATALPQVVTEYVLSGETVENWGELVTVQSVVGAAEDLSAEDFIALIRDPLMENCPSAMWNVIRRSPTEILAEWRTIGCVGPFDSDDQYELVRVVWGSWAVHRLAYTTKREPYLATTERDEWIERLDRAEIGVVPLPPNMDPTPVLGDSDSTAVSGWHHARDLRARGLHRPACRAGAKAPCAPDPLSRRVRAGEPGSGAGRARDPRRWCQPDQ